MRRSLRDGDPQSYAISLAFALLLASAPALGDALIPYMWVPMGQLFLFPLVVLIEAVVILGILSGTKLQAIGHSFLMNLASTAVGAALYLATGPFIGDRLYKFWWNTGFDWQSITAIGISLVFALVFFGVSWVVETIVLRRLRPASETGQVVKTTGIANAATYALLLALAIRGS